MEFSVRKLRTLAQICVFILLVAQPIISDDARNLQNHRNGILNFKDLADHWIGYPKSPYTSFSVTASPSTTTTVAPTSPPVGTTKKQKTKRKKNYRTSNRRRSDSYDDSEYRETQRSRERSVFDDFDYDYEGPLDAPYGSAYAPSPYILRTSAAASSPKAVVVQPSVSGSQTMKAIFAGTPRVATYVVPDAKRYVVQRVKSQAVYVPPASVPPSPSMYGAASSSGMRRVDPLDYDDNPRGSFLGPQDSFPPRPVMNKIAQPGQRQPCHGPDCHQHHKGLVRFYWRRVVYPPGSRRRPRRPRLRRNRRRRLRDGGRSPSDQKNVFYTEDDNAEEAADEANNDGDNESDDEEDEEEEEDNEDNDENDSSRRNTWQPGKAYGHDLNEGDNYDDQDRKMYRDKRYVYRNRKRRRRVFREK